MVGSNTLASNNNAQARQSQLPSYHHGAGTHGDSGSFTVQRNAPTGLISNNDKGQKNLTLNSSSPTKAETIKNKRVFIENTVDSILQSKSSKAAGASIMAKPVGAMSGTGATDVHPKVHSVSPRGTVGSSIVGLPNIVVGGNNTQAPNGAGTMNITKQNRSGGVSPTKGENSSAPMGAQAPSQAPLRTAALD